MISINLHDDLIIAEFNCAYFEFELNRMWYNATHMILDKSKILPIAYNSGLLEEKVIELKKNFERRFGGNSDTWQDYKFSLDLLHSEKLYQELIALYLEIIGVVIYRKMFVELDCTTELTQEQILHGTSTVPGKGIPACAYNGDNITCAFAISNSSILSLRHFSIEDIIRYMKVWLFAATSSLNEIEDFVFSLDDEASLLYNAAEYSDLFYSSIYTHGVFDTNGDDIYLPTRDLILLSKSIETYEGKTNYFTKVAGAFWSDTIDRFMHNKNIAPRDLILAREKAFKRKNVKDKYLKGILLTDEEIGFYFPHGSYSPPRPYGFLLAIEPITSFKNLPKRLIPSIVFTSKEIFDKSANLSQSMNVKAVKKEIKNKGIETSENIATDIPTKEIKTWEDSVKDSLMTSHTIENLILRCTLDEMLTLSEYIIKYKKGSCVVKDLEGDLLFIIPYAELKIPVSEVLSLKDIDIIELHEVYYDLEKYIPEEAIKNLCTVVRNTTIEEVE